MPPNIPIATYRVQLTAEFTFDDAAAIVPYLKALGISHLYASPFTKARAGSKHGYDIVDHAALNPELGGEAGFARMSDALKQHDLGLILDFVPNHAGVHYADNPWWLDVLEWGPASAHAASFDIEWDTLPYRARGGVLLPILGKPYGDVLEDGEFELRFDAGEGSFSVWYFDHRLPIAPERYSETIRAVVKQADAAETSSGKALLHLASRYKGLRHPNRKEAPAFKAELAAIKGGVEIITSGLKAYRADKDHPPQTQALHNLLERQHYKPGHWRLAASEINYRRFFDVNTLAGLRVEDAGTFDAIHALVKTLIADGRLHGLRLDHIDGLRDPAQYFQRLKRLVQAAQRSRKPFYTVIEKILGENEALVQLAGVQGTTGYEWLNAITQVLLDGRGLAPLDEIWRQISNHAPNFDPVLISAKRRVVATLLQSEFNVLTRLLARIAAGHYSTRDFSDVTLRQAFELYVLHFPVYRTYLTAAGPTPHDRALIEQTIAKARADWFATDEGLFQFLQDALTLDLLLPGRSAHSKPRVRRFAMKVQQFTGPTIAKSLEDTAFYRYHRLLALNEVGGDPAARELSPARFHDMMRLRAKQWPSGMTATATHDTKRGEDARTRILALAELPGAWTSAVSRWKILNAPHVLSDGDFRAPSSTFEYMLYQTLIGVWPNDSRDDTLLERVQSYALKAAREGKQETSWLNPNARYEDGVKQFIARILDPEHSAAFLDSLAAFAKRTSLLGALNSLSQITLKATLPGMPDFYQGTELWDTSLVDPDNRRPVDFAARAALLTGLEDPAWSTLTENWHDGRIKLTWTRQLLKLRNAMPEVFALGNYEPLDVSGPDRDHVIAFARRHGNNAAIVVIGRMFAAFTDGGHAWLSPDTIDATIHASDFEANGRSVFAASDLFADLPVAIMPARIRGTAVKTKRTRKVASTG